MTPGLLEPDEESPLEICNVDGRGPFVVLCDHAGRRVPRALGTLGLSEAELCAHIAWDIGARGLALRLAQELDAPLFMQRYSRLVIDCNRPLDAIDSIPEASGGVTIAGNHGLSPEARAARVRAVFEPYHAGIAAALAARGRYALVTVHSFTPELYGERRPFHAGVLYARDTRLAAPLLARLRADEGWVIGDNQPYAASTRSDFAVIEYGERRGAPYVELEVRQDLLADEAGQRAWAARLADALRIASAAFHW
jgi:predicted N-formylglutamate amidohydrolase